jgi:hypothetical protein
LDISGVKLKETRSRGSEGVLDDFHLGRVDGLLSRKTQLLPIDAFVEQMPGI